MDYPRWDVLNDFLGIERFIRGHKCIDIFIFINSQDAIIAIRNSVFRG